MTPLATLSVLATNFRKLRFLQSTKWAFYFSPFLLVFSLSLHLWKALDNWIRQQIATQTTNEVWGTILSTGEKKWAFQECSKKTLQRVNWNVGNRSCLLSNCYFTHDVFVPLLQFSIIFGGNWKAGRLSYFQGHESRACQKHRDWKNRYGSLKCECSMTVETVEILMVQFSSSFLCFFWVERDDFVNESRG